MKHRAASLRQQSYLLSRRWRQRERLHATGVPICSSACLFVCLSVAKLKKTRLCQKLSNLERRCLLTTYRKSYMEFSKNALLDLLKSKMAEIRHLENRHDVIFSAEGGPIWIKFRRLMQNDMSTAAVIWSKSKPNIEFQYNGRLGDFHGMSSQSHVSHCRVLLLGELTVMIPEPHATLQGAVTWRNKCHDGATLQGVIISSAILKSFFAMFYFFLIF